MCAFFLLLLFVAGGTPLLAGSARGEGDMLSVEETVALAKRVSDGGSSPARFALARRANPAARPVLYRILADPEQRRHWPAIVAFFGWLGQAEDVPKLVRFVESRKGSFAAFEGTAVIEVGRTLSVMTARGVPSAKNAVEKMIRPDYWRDLGFDAPAARGKGGLSMANTLAVRYLFGYAYSLDPTFEKKARKLLHGIEDPAQNELMGRQIERAIQFGRGVAEQYADWPQKFGVGVDPAAIDRYRAGLRGEVREPAAAVASITPNISDEDARYLLQTLREALAQYRTFTDMLIGGDAPRLAGHILDDGQTVPATRIKAQRAEFLRALGQQRDIAEAVNHLDARSSGFKVERRTAYRVGELDLDAQRVTAEQVGEVMVTFRLLGTAALGKAHFADQKGGLTVAKDGTLIVVMKKINGKWYWNPFGW